jgi:hypothetical protein
LAVPALALAQTPVTGGYGGQAGNVQEGVAGSGAAGGTLPFTGLDLVLMVAAAVLLLGAGLTMRRLARAKS